jgi:hypothetical protein
MVYFSKTVFLDSVSLRYARSGKEDQALSDTEQNIVLNNSTENRFLSTLYLKDLSKNDSVVYFVIFVFMIYFFQY